MSRPLSHEHRFLAQREAREAVLLAEAALVIGKDALSRQAELRTRFGVVESSCLGTVRDGALELYDGVLRLVDRDGQRAAEFAPAAYLDHIGERVESWSYLKFPVFRRGAAEESYRVGPLARLNVAERVTTPRAGRAFAEFRALGCGRPIHDTFLYHHARLIELLYATERAAELLEDDEIVSPEVRVTAPRRAGEGVGVIEAPRGTLIHHYVGDELGRVVRANLIVATGQNNAAINASVTAVAKEFVRGGRIDEGALNHVETVIRCYDPCLSCSTHALGKMPLVLELVSAEGSVLDSVTRSPGQ